MGTGRWGKSSSPARFFGALGADVVTVGSVTLAAGSRSTFCSARIWNRIRIVSSRIAAVIMVVHLITLHLIFNHPDPLWPYACRPIPSRSASISSICAIHLLSTTSAEPRAQSHESVQAQGTQPLSRKASLASSFRLCLSSFFFMDFFCSLGRSASRNDRKKEVVQFL